MLCDHPRKKMTSDQRKRRNIYDRHFLVAIGIAFRKRTAVAEPGIIDQEIDFEFFMINPFEKGLQLLKISEINFSNVNKKPRMLSLELISQFDQSFITPCDKNHRAYTTGELTCKFTTDAR